MEEKAGKMLHKGKAEIPSKDSMCLCLSSAQETNCKDQKETLGDKRQPITGNLQENRELFPISTGTVLPTNEKGFEVPPKICLQKGTQSCQHLDLVLVRPGPEDPTELCHAQISDPWKQ